MWISGVKTLDYEGHLSALCSVGEVLKGLENKRK
jgi:hypothetical protein